MDAQEKLQHYPQAVTPVYTTDVANASLQLFAGEFFLTQDNKTLSKERGNIEFIWLPSPKIRFTVPVANDRPELDMARLHLSHQNVSTEAIVTNVRIGSTDQPSYSGILAGEVIVQTNPQCDRVIFHVPNFTHFLGTIVRNTEANHAWRGRLYLEYTDWIINIDEISSGKEVANSIRNEGGFAITHVGVIQRKDGNLFSYQDIQPILFGLRYFLSFARGLWCGPILPVGMSTDSSAWQIWNTSHLSPWKMVESWFPYHEINQIHEVNKAFQGILSKLADPLWADPIKIAIHWFVEANLTNGGVEGAIVLTQTALELLSWIYFVEDPKTSTMKDTKFDKLRAEDKIRNLLTSLQIPTIIPVEMTHLAAFAATQGGADGPTSIVKLRNGVVHPKQIKRNYVLQAPRRARSEAQELGLWFLELALLHMIGYDSIYYPRFLHDYPSNTKTKVPWG